MNKDKLAKQFAYGLISILEKRKVTYLLPKIVGFLEEYDSSGKAVVYIPRKLSQSEAKNAEKLVFKTTKEHPSKIEFIEDGSIIDGLKIFYKDRLWDFSLSGRLTSINKQI